MKQIVIIFPGIGYTADKPLLYYGLDTACECGYEEYRKLSFTPQSKKNIRGNEEAMKEAFDELYHQAEEQLTDIDWNRYDDILFLSKSIGTIIAGAYASKHGLKNVKHVLYTPLKYTYQYQFSKAIAFIGTNDAWGDYREVVVLSEEAGVPIKVYQNANHSLEVPDDVINNINRILDVVEVTNEFLKSL